MAMIEKRGPAQYRVRVRRADVPKPISKTFESREEAEKWARRIESEVDAGKRVLFLSNAEAKSMTLREGLERYRDEKTVHKAGASQERNRIARELHDSVTQTIFSASLIAEVLPTVWTRDPVEAQNGLDDLRKLARGALAEMRTLLLELRPIGLGEVRLEDLLKQLGAGISGRIRAEVHVHAQGEAILPTDVKLAFYRIAQEALNNAAKHSGADRVDIEIKSVPALPSRKRKKAGSSQAVFSQSVSMSIRDNGRGFDPGSVIGEHLGLGIMRERATNTHTALSIKSKPGAGTEISLHWPQLQH